MNGPDRMCSIRGSNDQIELASRMIHDLMSDAMMVREICSLIITMCVTT